MRDIGSAEGGNKPSAAESTCSCPVQQLGLPSSLTVHCSTTHSDCPTPRASLAAGDLNRHLSWVHDIYSCAHSSHETHLGWLIYRLSSSKTSKHRPRVRKQTLLQQQAE